MANQNSDDLTPEEQELLKRPVYHMTKQEREEIGRQLHNPTPEEQRQRDEAAQDLADAIKETEAKDP